MGPFETSYSYWDRGIISPVIPKYDMMIVRQIVHLFTQIYGQLMNINMSIYGLRY